MELTATLTEALMYVTKTTPNRSASVCPATVVKFLSFSYPRVSPGSLKLITAPEVSTKAAFRNRLELGKNCSEI
jgi:hypothetical protein